MCSCRNVTVLPVIILSEFAINLYRDKIHLQSTPGGLPMSTITRFICVATIFTCGVLTSQSESKAQYPVYYAPASTVAPAVVGYTARRGGLFGQRVVVRPVVAPVMAPSAVVVERPVVPVEPAAVQAYYAPPVPVAVPVTTYRVPVVTFYGF